MAKTDQFSATTEPGTKSAGLVFAPSVVAAKEGQLQHYRARDE